jgi:hypothetical protein
VHLPLRINGGKGFLVMKRLVPFLILVAFGVGISGNRVGHPNGKLSISASTQSSPQIAIYIPGDEFSNKWDVSEELPSPPSNLAFFYKPSRNNLQRGDLPSPTSPKHYSWLGYGCGGLPS